MTFPEESIAWKVLKQTVKKTKLIPKTRAGQSMKKLANVKRTQKTQIASYGGWINGSYLDD